MRIAFWRPKVVARAPTVPEEVLLRVHRLEIQQTQVMELLEQNTRLYQKLIRRLDGERGGRPGGGGNVRSLPPIVPGQPYPHHGG